MKVIFKGSSFIQWEHKGYQYQLAVLASSNGEFLGHDLCVINPVDKNVIGIISHDVPGDRWSGSIYKNAEELILKFAGEEVCNEKYTSKVNGRGI